MYNTPKRLILGWGFDYIYDYDSIFVYLRPKQAPYWLLLIGGKYLPPQVLAAPIAVLLAESNRTPKTAPPLISPNIGEGRRRVINTLKTTLFCSLSRSVPSPSIGGDQRWGRDHRCYFFLLVLFASARADSSLS